MRATSLLSGLAVSLSAVAPGAQAAINVTENNNVDLAAGTGDLGWGATGLSYGYSAGCGLNFSSGFVAAGFNAGIPDEADGNLGGGFTLNDTTMDFGFGAVLGNQTVGIVVLQDRTTGEVQVTVNGKVVEL